MFKKILKLLKRAYFVGTLAGRLSLLLLTHLWVSVHKFISFVYTTILKAWESPIDYRHLIVVLFYVALLRLQFLKIRWFGYLANAPFPSDEAAVAFHAAEAYAKDLQIRRGYGIWIACLAVAIIRFEATTYNKKTAIKVTKGVEYVCYVIIAICWLIGRLNCN